MFAAWLSIQLIHFSAIESYWIYDYHYCQNMNEWVLKRLMWLHFKSFVLLVWTKKCLMWKSGLHIWSMDEYIQFSTNSEIFWNQKIGFDFSHHSLDVRFLTILECFLLPNNKSIFYQISNLLAHVLNEQLLNDIKLKYFLSWHFFSLFFSFQFKCNIK